jgi:hypothetical protein
MTNTPARLTPILSGVAGEYFVAAELSRLGYIATLTLKNTRGIDIIATNSSAACTVAIQVKTNQDDARKWMLNSKVESGEAPNVYFVFVSLCGRAQPRYHVVPAAIVSDYCRRTHKAYLAEKGRGGLQRKDTSMRAFRDPDDEYLNAWHVLGLDGQAI